MTTTSETPAPDAVLDATAVIARDLIRFDTSNFGEGKSHGETDAAEYIAARLERLGVSAELIDSEPGRTSVIARVAGANPDRGALVVHGHTDVVPAMAEDWSVDPFGGVIRDGMLWGRGAVDMKNMDAMILTSLEDILSSGRQPARDLVIAFFADEEAGGVLGSHHLVKNRPELFAGATEAISEVGGYSIDLDGTRAYLVQTGEKALIWAKLVARGTAGHGSQINRDNAITRLAGAVARIGSQEWPVHDTR
jgi:acetylornithine deacetylase/succinyl-diaminopimelate desuccinylase-like protein